MKRLASVLLLLLMSCHSISKELLEDSLLVKILATGEMKELNGISKNIDEQLFLRLYSVSNQKENCFLETHGICNYQYYISVSSFDEYPDTAFFPIKLNGVVKKIDWLESPQVDSALLHIEMDKYTIAALKNNKDLVNVRSDFKLKVSLNHIAIIQ